MILECLVAAVYLNFVKNRSLLLISEIETVIFDICGVFEPIYMK